MLTSTSPKYKPPHGAYTGKPERHLSISSWNVGWSQKIFNYILWSNHIDNGQIVNKSDDGSELLLGLSREVAFVRDSIDIIKSEVHQLRTEIILPPKKESKKPEPHDKPAGEICSLVKYHTQPANNS